MGKNSKKKTKKTKSTSNILKALTAELFQKCVNPTESSTPSPKERFNSYKEIREMILNIEKQKGPSSVSQLKKREDCIPEFLEWAEKKGIFFESVELKSVRSSELGVFAKKNLAAAEVFIKVPQNAMITSESLTRSPIAQIIAEDPMLNSMPNVALALLLLYELFNESSEWQPYINILPRSYNNILYFDIPDIDMLKGTSVYLEALNVLRSIARQYAYISNLLLRHPLGVELGLADKITYADYRWAVATLMTRQNSVPSSNGPAPDLALIPFLDLCNHSEGIASIDYNEENHTCECFSPTAIEKGNEVLIHYGSRPNTELVIYNGFFYTGNSFDYLKVKLGISKTDPDFEIRTGLLRKLGMEDTFRLGCLPLPVKGAMKAFLYIMNATLNELESMVKLEKAELETELENESIVGHETITKCFVFLKDRCSFLLKLLPLMPPSENEASVTADQRITAELSKALRNNERRILSEAISYAEKQLENLEI